MGLMKKMASVLVTASLLFGLVGTAFATTPSEVNAAASRLQELGIVVGDSTGDMKLGDPITRAQLMKIMVWAFGQKDNAQILKGANAFPDTANHWASGEIAIAKNIIVEKNHFEMGMPDGTFAPEGKVTAAQAVAFLMKFLGVSPDSSKTWPNNYLDAAVSSGMISAEVRDSIAATANTEATRGLVFFLADTAFAGYPVSTGKTVYTTYVKPSAPTLTVEASELTTTASKVTVSGTVSADAKSVYVGSTANTVSVSNGSFSAEIDLTMGANSIVVGATDIVGGTTTKTLTVTRTVGVAASIDAPASITVVAGETADLAVAVKDAQGNTLEADVTVTSDLGTFANGQFTAGEKSGSGTATVTSGDLSVSVNVTVNPGALEKIVVTPATIDLSAGGSQKFVATGADKFGNEVALSNAVNWSASKGVVGPDGTFGATSDSAGTVTITASSGTVSGSATATVFGVPAKVQIAAPAELVGNDASETTLTASVLDANGNLVKTFNGNVTFASSNQGAVTVETATVAAVNGMASTTINGKAYGTTVLSASASNVAGTTVTFTTTKQVLTSIALTASPATIAASTAAVGSVKAVALDQTGNEMLSLPKALTIKLTSNDTNVVTFNQISYTNQNLPDPNETFSNVVNGTSAPGATTISGAVTTSGYTDIPVNSVSINTTIVGGAYQLAIDAISDKKAGESSTAYIRVLDFNGNQTTNVGTTAGINVKVVDYYGDSHDVATNVSASYGVYKATIDWSNITVDRADQAGTYTVKATATGLKTAEQTANVLSADAKVLKLTATPGTLAADGASTGTLTVAVKDQYGNTVKAGSYSVTIKKSTDRGVTQAFADTTVTTSEGTASVLITATTKQGTGAGTGDVYTASATGLMQVSKEVFTQVLGVAHKLSVGSIDPMTAGGSTIVPVTVQDANTNPLTYDNGRVVTVTVKDGDTVLGTFTGTTENGVAEVEVTGLTAAATGLTASATADGLVKASNTFNVVAASPAKLSISADRSVLTSNTASEARLTFQLRDQYGNKASLKATDAAVDVYVKADTSDFGAFQGTAVAAPDEHAGWFKYTIASNTGYIATTDDHDFAAKSSTAGTTVINAVATGLESATISIETKLYGDPTKLAYATMDDVVAQAVASGGVPGDINNPDLAPRAVTISLTDGNGTVLTHNSTATVTPVLYDSPTGTTMKYFTKSGSTWSTYTIGTPITVSKGQATFYFVSTKTGDVTFKATSAAIADGAYYKTASAVVVAGDPVGVKVVTSDPAIIAANGYALTTVTAQVVDILGNVVDTYSNGTMDFSIYSGSDYATLLATSAPITQGEAVVAAQSKLVPGSSQDIYVKVKSDVAGDATLEVNNTVGEKAFTADGKNPDAVVLGDLTFGASGAISGRPSVIAAGGTFVDDTDLDTVEYEYRNVTANGPWTSIATKTDGEDLTLNLVGSDWGSVSLVAGDDYVFRITVTDVAGNTFAYELPEANKITVAAAAASAQTIASAVYDKGANTLTITTTNTATTDSLDLSKITVKDMAGPDTAVVLSSLDVTDITWNSATEVVLTIADGSALDSFTNTATGTDTIEGAAGFAITLKGDVGPASAAATTLVVQD